MSARADRAVSHGGTLPFRALHGVGAGPNGIAFLAAA